MSNSENARTQGERADQTRGRILDAAVRAFSEHGLAGARTEQIAEAAGVNKALLYYYFHGKDALYAAALETMAKGVVATGIAALEADGPAGERLLRFALSHFDRIHSQRAFQSLMQHEMMRLHRGEENALTPLVETIFRPSMMRLLKVYREGRRTGELIDVEETQVLYAALGANVFYFLSAPMMGMILGAELFATAALAARRKAAIEYLGQSIFVDREHGAALAARVLEQTPMPEPQGFGMSKAVMKQQEARGM